jgi:GT2 family glycosyltransferase
MLFRRRIFAAAEFIDEGFRHSMDFEFFLRLASKGYRFALIPAFEGRFRLHAAAKTSRQQEICVRENMRLYRQVYRDANLPRSLRRKALASYHTLCGYLFSHSQFSLFKEGFDDLLALDGLRALTWPMLARYLCYRLGPAAAEAAVTLHRALRIGRPTSAGNSSS